MILLTFLSFLYFSFLLIYKNACTYLTEYIYLLRIRWISRLDVPLKNTKTAILVLFTFWQKGKTEYINTICKHIIVSTWWVLQWCRIEQGKRDGECWVCRVANVALNRGLGQSHWGGNIWGNTWRKGVNQVNPLINTLRPSPSVFNKPLGSKCDPALEEVDSLRSDSVRPGH